MDQRGSTDILLFKGFRFHSCDRELFRVDEAGNGSAVSIGSRALDLLALLAERPEKLVTKSEIIQVVWGGAAVEEANLTVQISALRRILDQNSEQSSCIQTVPGRGYRFVAPVKRVEPASTPVFAALPGGDSRSFGPALPDKPSIAVLPFANLSGDPEQEYFADGMVEEIITALSRIRWLFVIARNSSFTYKGQAIDVKQVGRELGVRYVLEGSVRKSGRRVRIAAQLIDAVSGTHLWADHFEGSLEDAFELQDKVAISAAGVIEPTLQVAEIRRATALPTTDPTAYDLYSRALAYWGSWEKEGITLALSLLAQALERDPHYGPALAAAALYHQQLHVNGWAEDWDENRLISLNLARRAIRAAPDDPDVLGRVAMVWGSVGEELETAIGLIDRCLALNPSFAIGWHWSGVLRIWAGQPDLAIEHFDASLRLSQRDPRDRPSLYLTGIGECLFFKRRFDEASTKLLASLEQLPTHAITSRLLAACYAHMARLDKASEIVRRLRVVTPEEVPHFVPYRNPEHRELFLSGLRLAAGTVA
ncbi:MAG: winged helix-turn-helix domain-containing protein [Alphaproteobacteria bacterium]|nr:winged helix-turn-helix domain-containing protein [Alphaproteobacteria bacterium]